MCASDSIISRAITPDEDHYVADSHTYPRDNVGNYDNLLDVVKQKAFSGMGIPKANQTMPNNTHFTDDVPAQSYM